jgi:hypothetical protein
MSGKRRKLLIHREFVVDAPLATAWEHLAQIRRWPSWARHIKRIDVVPDEELGAETAGLIHLRNGIESRFQMTEFEPLRSWKWVGPFLWFTVHYDHLFEPIDERRTKMTFVVEAEGRGVAVVGPLFAAIYSRNLDRAIPNLKAEIAAIAVRPESRSAD